MTLIGIDWGTTHRRSYRLRDRGVLEDERHDDQGGLVVQGRWAESFAALAAGWPVDAPVVMSGMVGSASGWREARYLDASTPLTTLSQHLVTVPDAPGGRRCAIVPGYRWNGPGGEVDVMRGEETQLLGALALGHGDGWYLLPGTHSKWVLVERGAVKLLRTYMTGELFATLGRHGTLAGLVGEQDVPEAFQRGLDVSATGPLTHTVFGCRARVVSGEMPAAHARSYLSGLLIGSEWVDALQQAHPAPQRLHLIASGPLVAGYDAAARRHGCSLNVLDPHEVYLAALWALKEGVTP
jgi:2-dehydro-3-deoxygalactonokinase